MFLERYHSFCLPFTDYTGTWVKICPQTIVPYGNNLTCYCTQPLWPTRYFVWSGTWQMAIILCDLSTCTSSGLTRAKRGSAPNRCTWALLRNRRFEIWVLEKNCHIIMYQGQIPGEITRLVWRCEWENSKINACATNNLKPLSSKVWDSEHNLLALGVICFDHRLKKLATKSGSSNFSNSFIGAPGENSWVQ